MELNVFSYHYFHIIQFQLNILVTTHPTMGFNTKKVWRRVFHMSSNSDACNGMRAYRVVQWTEMNIDA